MAAATAVLVLAAATPGPAPADRGLADFREGQFAEAFRDWREAADAGDARGALYIGVLYDSGMGVKQDYRQAMAWYRRAASAGSAAGAFNVAVMFDAGLGVAKDPAEAARWYGRAAAGGFARAEYNLAMLYETGTGVPRDRRKAVALYRRAAFAGIAAARAHLVSLGSPYQAPGSAKPDAALRDFAQAQALLLGRGPADMSRMAALFRRAAEQHNALAEYDLGYCYEHGIGVGPDRAQARDFYSRAAADAADPSLRAIAMAGAGGADGGAAGSH